MTTTIKIHVNGRYMAVVKQDGVGSPVEVHGNYEGSPNPSGEHEFRLVHGSLSNKFVVSEYYVPEKVPETAGDVVEQNPNVESKDAEAQGAVLETSVKG